MSITIEELMSKMEEIIKVNEKLSKENGKYKKEIERMKMMDNNFTVEIGCNLIQGTNISSPGKDVDMNIKYGEIISMSSNDVSSILKGSNNRDFFANNLLYFVDEENYNRFNIKKKIDIGRENIKNIILKNDISSMIRFFDDVTRKKMNNTVVHTVYYTIVILDIDGELNGMQFNTRQEIEKYFGMELKYAEMLYSRMKDIMI